MPRLPTILLTEGIAVPQGPRYPQRAGGDGGAAAAIAAGGAAVANALFDVANDRARQAEKEARQEAALLSADAEQRIGIGDVTLRATQKDPDAYTADYDKLIEQAVKDVSAGAKNAQAAALMRQHMAPVLAKNRVGAAKHAQDLRVDQSVARLDATLDSRETQAGLAESDTDFQRQYQEGLNAIRLATPDIGADKAGDRARKFKQDILGARALKEANETPEVFVENADDRFGQAGLNPKRLEELKEHARIKAESNRKNYVAEWDKFYERVEKEAEEERKSQVVGLEQAGLKGQLTVSRLDDAKAMRIVTTRDEYATLYKLATEQKDAPSNKAVLQDASIKAHRAVPAITPAELDVLYRKGDLNRQDWKELKDKVIARGDHLKSEGQSDKTRAMTQGEQILGRALGISSLYDKIDEQDKQLYDIGLRELTARAFDGKEDGVAVANEIVDRFAPIRQERLKLKVTELGRTLRFPAQDSLTADLLLKFAVQDGKVMPGSPEEAQEKRKILDMKRAEDAALVKAKEKAQSKSGGGGGTLGRKPGDKPKTGTTE